MADTKERLESPKQPRSISKAFGTPSTFLIITIIYLRPV